jgi:hypothetical protein
MEIAKKMTVQEFAALIGKSPRTVESYVDKLGMPSVREDGRRYIPLPAGNVWLALRIIAEGIRKSNPRMPRDEIRIRARAIWLEETQDDRDFDLP